MGSTALQALVKRIFSDGEAKRRFLADPDSVLATVDLTEREKQAVRRVHARLGLVTANSTQLEVSLDSSITWFVPPKP